MPPRRLTQTAAWISDSSIQGNRKERNVETIFNQAGVLLVSLHACTKPDVRLERRGCGRLVAALETSLFISILKGRTVNR